MLIYRYYDCLIIFFVYLTNAEAQLVTYTALDTTINCNKFKFFRSNIDRFVN